MKLEERTFGTHCISVIVKHGKQIVAIFLRASLRLSMCDNSFRNCPSKKNKVATSMVLISLLLFQGRVRNTKN